MRGGKRCGGGGPKRGPENVYQAAIVERKSPVALQRPGGEATVTQKNRFRHEARRIYAEDTMAIAGGPRLLEALDRAEGIAGHLGGAQRAGMRLSERCAR